MANGDYCSFFRVKMAEECFKQAREKASYNVKPKHATGIVCIYAFCQIYYIDRAVFVFFFVFSVDSVGYLPFSFFLPLVQIGSSPNRLFLTDTCQGVEETTLLAPTVTH